jgi:hypothetical protein
LANSGECVAEIRSLAEAIRDLVHDGDCVAMEGFTHLIPVAAGQEIIRQGRKDLTLVRLTPDIVFDQLIGMGCAKKLVFGWGGNPGVGALHRFRDAIENGWPNPLEIEQHSHAGLTNLQLRLASPGWTLTEGPIIEKAITAMRSYVCEPVQYGRLYLAGDAAHIVPPTGAKGMNLAIADVTILARALADWFHRGDHSGLDDYSDRCLGRVWRVQDFSNTMTELLHVLPAGDPFASRVQRAKQRYVATSQAMQHTIAENYVGLPLD